ncbi:MAG: HEPN domain-containing protein [Calditrichaeota bacterium]|nr:MAG: HEPN domain-containing protein [Calditrichota bacterium]
MNEKSSANKSSPVSVSKNWLDFAQEDLEVVELLAEQQSSLYRTICFHAQQYVEKILKGILESLNQKIPRIHDINVLVEMCSNFGVKIPLTETEIHFLSSIYIDVRYPPDVGSLPDGAPLKSDADVAIQSVKKVKKWVDEYAHPSQVD